MQRFIANSISQLFGPLVLWPIFLACLLLGTGLSEAQQWQLVLPLVLIELVLPFTVFLLLRKLGIITDMEITNVRERRWYFVVLCLSHMAAVWLLWQHGNPLAWHIRFLALVVAVIGTVITFYWKVSVHLGTATFVYMTIVLLFGWGWIWLGLILPLVAWSRIVKRKHTFMQTVAGCGLTILVYALGWSWL